MRKLVWILFTFALGCGSSNGSPGGQGGGGGNTQPTVCYDEFNTQPDGSFPVVPCCPSQPPDCSGVPDGTVSYPGQGGATYCALPTDFFCFCACHGSTWSCNLDGVTPGGGACGPSAHQ